VISEIVKRIAATEGNAIKVARVCAMKASKVITARLSLASTTAVRGVSALNPPMYQYVSATLVTWVTIVNSHLVAIAVNRMEEPVLLTGRASVLLTELVLTASLNSVSMHATIMDYVIKI